MVNFQEIANTFNTGLQEEYKDPWIKWHFNLKSWVDEAVYKVCFTLGAQQEKKFLDVGTGTGDNTILLSQIYPNCSFEASDISRIYITKAQQTLFQKAINNVAFSVADVHKLPYEDNTFDVITCFFSLMYFKDVNHAIKELSRVCKPNGKILLLTWGGDNVVFSTIMEILEISNKNSYPMFKNPNAFAKEESLFNLYREHHENFTSISIDKQQINMQWIGDAFSFWNFFKASNPSVVQLLDSLEFTKRKAKEVALIAEIAKFERNGVLFLPASMLLSKLSN